jgi:hypothetical protein
MAPPAALNPNTVAQWQTRAPVTDAPMGPKPPHSPGLSPEADARMVACRQHTLLPLDDCLVYGDDRAHSGKRKSVAVMRRVRSSTRSG